MKTYDEMAKYVLEVRDEYEKKRARRITATKRCIPAVAGLFCTLIVVFGVWKGNIKPEKLPSVDEVTVTETISASTATMMHTTETTSAAKTTVFTTASSSTKTTASSAVPTASSVTSVTVFSTAETTSAAVQSTSASATTEQHTSATTSSSVTVTTTVTNVTTVTVTETTTLQFTGGGGSIGEGGWPFGGDGGNGGYGGGSNGGGASSGEGNGGGIDPWYNLPLNQQFNNAYIDGYGAIFVNGYLISPEAVGDWIGVAVMQSQAPVEGLTRTCKAKVYYLNDISDDTAVAIRFNGYDEYYLYCVSGTDIYDMMKIIPPE